LLTPESFDSLRANAIASSLISTPVTFLRSELLYGKRVLSGVALKVKDGLAAQITKKRCLFGEEFVPALAEEARLVLLVAVVRLCRLVPGEAVLLVQLPAEAVARS
jgi:hypothetical protein